MTLPKLPPIKRIKERYNPKPTARERAFHKWVRSLPCLVCGRTATLHHVTARADRMGRIERSHKRVVPLCNIVPHHQAVFDSASDPQSVESLSHRGFYEKHGIDLYTEANRLWDEWEKQGLV